MTNDNALRRSLEEVVEQSAFVSELDYKQEILNSLNLMISWEVRSDWQRQSSVRNGDLNRSLCGVEGEELSDDNRIHFCLHLSSSSSSGSLCKLEWSEDVKSLSWRMKVLMV